jgi:co-chaperonin GroES (HSP10)
VGEMKAVNKYIIVEQIKEELKTNSGLLLTGDDKDNVRYNKGKVIKPGSQVTVINEGDIIYYDRHAGHMMLLEDKPYTIILERDVVVVV